MAPVERYSISGLNLYKNSFAPFGISVMLKFMCPESSHRTGTTLILYSTSRMENIAPPGERIIPSDENSPALHNMRKSNATAPRSERVSVTALRKRMDAAQSTSTNAEATASHGAMDGQRRVHSKQRAKTMDVIVPVLTVKTLFHIRDKASLHLIGGSSQ